MPTGHLYTYYFCADVGHVNGDKYRVLCQQRRTLGKNLHASPARLHVVGMLMILGSLLMKQDSSLYQD